MSLIEAVVLGIVQGLTEFLPVSSSGHLVIFQHLFGINEPVLAFDIAVHVGTLLAVAVYFFRDIVAIVTGFLAFAADSFRHRRLRMPDAQAPQARMAILIVIGSVPTAVIGLALKDSAEALFSSVTLVGISLCITGAILWGTRRLGDTAADEGTTSVIKALAIGVVQGLAVVPGISRSGSTIAAGLYLGLGRETAARFSFLLSIPAVAGAGLLGALDLLGGGAIPLPIMAAGLVTSAVVGYAALALLVWIVKQGRMHLFALYCLAVGLVSICLTLL